MEAPADYSDSCNAFVVPLRRYYVLIIVVVGVFCNLLNVMVFTVTRLRRRSPSLYMASLAGSDTCFLVVLGLYWCRDNLGFSFLDSPGWCQLLMYTHVTSGFFGVWVTVAFTTERLVAVRFPLHRRHVCTFSRAKVIILVILAVSLLCSTHALVTMGVVDPEKGRLCGMKKDWVQYLKAIFVADAVLTLILPLGLITGMNAMIVQSLMKTRRKLKLNQTVNTEDTEVHSDFHEVSWYTSAVKQHDEEPGNSSAPELDVNEPSVVVQPARRSGSSKKVQSSVTKMMLLISISFLVLNTPSYVVRLLWVFFPGSPDNIPPILKCMQRLTLLLYYTNYAINFLLYTFCGKMFRKCLVEMFRGYFKRFVATVGKIRN